jgi:hypothetical protein
VRQHEVVIGLKQHDLLPQTVLALAQRIHATANSGDMLADGQVEAFDKRRLDLPATGSIKKLGRQGCLG